MGGITFGTDGWRATLDEFTTERVRRVGRAIASYLLETTHNRSIAVGYDARPSSIEFAESLASELSNHGFDVVTSDRDLPTPLYAYGVVDRQLAGAVIVTASHNPPEYNGVKFVPSDGAPASTTVMDAIATHLSSKPEAPEGAGSIETVDFTQPYAEHVMDLIDVDFDGLSITYDGMHGSGRGVTDRLLEDSGAELSRIRCTRAADFGGHGPNPVAANLSELIARIEQDESDIGIANDGDADRIAVVTPDRGLVDANLLFAAIYEHLLGSETGPAVRTVSTTYLIDRIATEHGESVHEVPVGFKHVAAAMAEHDALVGGEESGGFSIAGHVREKDGVMTALLVSSMEAVEPLDKRIDRIRDRYGPVVQGKRSVDCPDDRKSSVIQSIGDTISDSIAGVPIESIEDADGYKLQLSDGSWILLRPSGTEPVMRVYAEGEDEQAVERLLDAGRRLVEQAL